MTVPDYYAETPEARAICFNCPLDDCVGTDKAACPLRQKFTGEHPKPKGYLSPRTLAALQQFTAERLVSKAIAEVRRA